MLSLAFGGRKYHRGKEHQRLEHGDRGTEFDCIAELVFQMKKPCRSYCIVDLIYIRYKTESSKLTEKISQTNKPELLLILF